MSEQDTTQSNEHKAAPQPGFVTMIYELPPGHDPPSVELRIPEDVFWPAYRTIHEIGVKDTYALLKFAGDLSGALQELGVPNIQDVFKQLWERIGDPGRMGSITWENTTEAALVLTYTMLQAGQIDWERAAAIAGFILKKRISDDAWRKRMGRWTERTGRDPVRLYNRKGDKTDA